MNNNETKLSTKLRILLNEVDVTETPLSIGHMVQATGSKGFGILMLFLAMPSALPMPVPIFSIPFGTAIAFLIIQILTGKQTPWLPEKVNRTILSLALSKTMLKSSIKLLNTVEHLIRPRYSWICNNKFAYILLLILTCILILPLPLTNTAPSAIIFLFSIGLIENDGIVCLIAFILGLILACLYLTIAYLIFTLGINATTALIKAIFN